MRHEKAIRRMFVVKNYRMLEYTSKKSLFGGRGIQAGSRMTRTRHHIIYFYRIISSN
jgi:hypothetical protein